MNLSAQVISMAGGTLRALRHSRNFRLLWLGSVVSNSGSWMQLVARGWLVLELSGSALDLGLVGLARAVPSLLFVLFGGALADFMDRRRLLYATQTVSAVSALALAVLTSLGAVQVWHVLALTFVSGAALAVDQPARQALVPQLVRREDLLNALALNSVAFQGAALFGPALTGILVPFIGLAGCFYANAASYAGVLVALLCMDWPGGPAARRGESTWADLVAGFRAAWTDKRILGLLLMMAVTSFFARGYNAFLPVFTDLLGAGVTGLSLLSVATGLGTVAASFILASMASLSQPGRVVIVTSLGLAVFLLVYAWSQDFWLTFGALVLVGALNVATRTVNNTTIQILSRDEVRGRVMGLFSLATHAAMPLGQAPMGWWMDRVGPRWAVTTGAVLTLVCVLAVAGLMAGLWRSGQKWAATAAEPRKPVYPGRSHRGDPT